VAAGFERGLLHIESRPGQPGAGVGEGLSARLRGNNGGHSAHGAMRRILRCNSVRMPKIRFSPALRSSHPLFQRPSPQRQFPSISKFLAAPSGGSDAGSITRGEALRLMWSSLTQH
jgi:hypothetical protein